MQLLSRQSNNVLSIRARRPAYSMGSQSDCAPAADYSFIAPPRLTTPDFLASPITVHAPAPDPTPRYGPSFREITLASLALLPILAYALLVGHLQHNLPIFDDYIIQLELARLKAEPAFMDKMGILFGQLNEHRLVYTRSWFWLVQTLHGTLSYSTLIVVGNLSLVGVWLLLVKLVRRSTPALLAAIPLSWILFQLHYHDNSLWAMASLQNLTIHLLYVLLFVLVLQPDRFSWVASWGVAALLCFTSGNGFVGVALAGVALVYQRRWRDTLYWAGMTLVLFLLYFWSYDHPSIPPAAHAMGWQHWGAALLIFLGLYLDCLPSTSFTYHLLNGLAVCVPVLALTGWSSWQLFDHWRSRKALSNRETTLLITVLIVFFIMISAAAAVQNRWAFMGWRGLTESRYRLYSTLFVLAGYVQFIRFTVDRRWSVNRWGWGALGLVMLMWVGIYRQQIGAAYLFSSRALPSYHNWTQMQPAATQRLFETVFTPTGQDARTLDLIRQTVAIRPNQYPSVEKKVSSVTEFGHEYVIRGNAATGNAALPDWTMLVFWSSDHYLLFPVEPYPNRDRFAFWFRQHWFGHGFKVGVARWHLQPVPYQLGVLTSTSNRLAVCRTARAVHP